MLVGSTRRVFPLSLVRYLFAGIKFSPGRHHSLAAVSLRCTPYAVELQGSDTKQGHGVNDE